MIKYIKGQLDGGMFDIHEINVIKAQRTNQVYEAYETLSDSDNILISLPLYVDNLPSHLLEFIIEFEKYYNEKLVEAKNTKTRFYAIINNGFIEGTQNINAINILKNFAEKVSFKWRFAIGIGAGEFMKEPAAKWTSKLKMDVYNRLTQLADDIKSNDIHCVHDVYTNPAMPKFLFMLGGTKSWHRLAKKNHLEKKQLYDKPYK
ncbi:MAG: flavodoxin [Clostridia bacterium]|nr:flavodoxin [Clostridia bacterium]